MKDSTSSVKASYLAPITVEITELYLRDHANPQKMSFKALYKGLTGVETHDFFHRKFNPTVEKKMQKVIREVMQKSNRLREEDQEEESTNRFDNIDLNNDDVYYSGSESSENESNSEMSDDLDF